MISKHEEAAKELKEILSVQRATLKLLRNNMIRNVEQLMSIFKEVTVREPGCGDVNSILPKEKEQVGNCLRPLRGSYRS